MSSIFISYRREDSQDVVGRIFDYLSNEFSKDNIFKDVDSIPLGTDFRSIIENSVDSCEVILAVIGNKWLELADSSGERRLDDPDDFVRIEIETGLKRGIPVIPVLVKNAKMPTYEQLPSSLKTLAYQNGLEIRSDPDFKNDIHKLIESLKTKINPPIKYKQYTRLFFYILVIISVPIFLFYSYGYLKNTWVNKNVPSNADIPCIISGIVFNSEDDSRMSGLWVDLYRDLSGSHSRPKELKKNVATTGPNGEFKIDCKNISKSEYPLLLALRHRDWMATRITGPKIEQPGKWDGINIPLRGSRIELKPFKDVGVSFSSKEIGNEIYLKGLIENMSNKPVPCIIARFDMKTPYSERIQGKPVKNLGFLDVMEKNILPNEKRAYQKKMPRKVGIGLYSKMKCKP